MAIVLERKIPPEKRSSRNTIVFALDVRFVAVGRVASL
jgi:hypothetical protein